MYYYSIFKILEHLLLNLLIQIIHNYIIQINIHYDLVLNFLFYIKMLNKFNKSNYLIIQLNYGVKYSPINLIASIYYIT